MAPAGGLALCAVALLGCVDDGGPRLTAAAPARAAHNAMVTLTGTRLCGTSGDCASAGGEILVGLGEPLVRAVVTSYADTTAVIVIPPEAAVGDSALIATVNDTSSNALDFTVLP
jgi:hypothetical protein